MRLTYQIFLEVHDFNLSKELNFEEVKSKIETISANIIKAEENKVDHLTDIEMQESIMRELIFDYCVSKNYEVDEFPSKQLKKIENNEPVYNEDYLSLPVTEFYLNKLTLEKEDVFELRKIALQKYYPRCNSEKVYEQARLYIKLAEEENLSFDGSKDRVDKVPKKF